MNFGDETTPYTRVTEHKHFSPWETHEKTVCFREYSRLANPGDTPYYPIRLAHDKGLLHRYIAAAEQADSVSFVGRLGTYRYLDMDATIGEALRAADGILQALSRGASIPSFFSDPL